MNIRDLDNTRDICLLSECHANLSEVALYYNHFFLLRVPIYVNLHLQANVYQYYSHEYSIFDTGGIIFRVTVSVAYGVVSIVASRNVLPIYHYGYRKPLAMNGYEIPPVDTHLWTRYHRHVHRCQPHKTENEWIANGRPDH